MDEKEKKKKKVIRDLVKSSPKFVEEGGRLH